MTPARQQQIDGLEAAMAESMAKPAKAWAWRLREIELHHGGLLPFDPAKPIPEDKRQMTQAQQLMWRQALRSDSAKEPA